MAISKRDGRRVLRQGLLLTASGLAAAAGAAWLYMIFLQPPQIGVDEQAFSAVDALFTAVTGHNEKLVSDCEQRLHELTDQGKLPQDAADYLDEVIKMCHAGQWDPAAKRLYGFMRAQRRDNNTSRTPKAKNTVSMEQSPTHRRGRLPRTIPGSSVLGASLRDAMT